MVVTNPKKMWTEWKKSKSELYTLLGARGRLHVSLCSFQLLCCLSNIQDRMDPVKDMGIA